MRAIILAFVASYVLLTGIDALSTYYGLASGAAHEANQAVATQDGMLQLGRMLAINSGMLAVFTFMLWWALRNRHRIGPDYLNAPHRAMFAWLCLTPFAERNVPKSALLYIAMAPSLLLVKALASVNNGLIGAGLPDIITPIARFLDRFLDGQAVYWALMTVITMPLLWVSLHMAVWLVKRLDAGATAVPAAA